MKAQNNIHDFIRDKGESLKGNRFLELVVKHKTGRPLEYWLERNKKREEKK